MSAEQTEKLRSDQVQVDRGLRTELWLTLLPRLRSVARSLGVADVDIDDILQEVYVTALEKCRADWNAGYVTGWLYRVTINRCHLWHRQMGRQNRAQQNLALQLPANHGSDRSSQAGHAPSQPLIQAEDQSLVQEQLAQLAPAFQEVLVLKYFADYNAQQIAELLEIPPATVRTRLRQARLRLAAALEKTGFEYE